VILAIISTTVGIEVKKAIDKHRFESSCSRIVCKLRYAKRLALANQCDVYVDFVQNKNELLTIVDFAGDYSIKKAAIKERFSDFFIEISGKKEFENKKNLRLLYTSTGSFFPNVKIRFYNSAKKNKEIDLEEFFKTVKSL
jgi:hypothetical protein